MNCEVTKVIITIEENDFPICHDYSDRAFWISIHINDGTFELVHSSTSRNAIFDSIIGGQVEYDAKDYDDTCICHFLQR
ncbi:hypothetical protein KR100_09435 [Synechococcus sp. KORDI-100]|nr:hypothetical protein KR100_09435 [Synechococcus sp. KORDI-100]